MGKGVVKLGEGNWAVKDGNLLAAKETNGRFKNAEFTVSRGTDATYVNRDGLIVNETGDNTPRIDFTDNTDGHLLLEPASRNLITYSEDFSVWNKNGATTTPNDSISPSGILNAAKLKPTKVSGVHLIGFNVTSSNVKTYSVFAKQNGYTRLRFNTGSSSNGFASFNLSNGSVAASGGTYYSSSNIENYGNGWYRCSVTFLANAPNNFSIVVEDSSANVSFVGDGVSSIYVWGAQVEEQSYATSYIPTNGGTVTRDAETCIGAGEAIDFNSEEGVLYAEISSFKNGGIGDRTISISDGSTQNAIQLFIRNTANRINFRLRSSGNLDVNISDFTFEQNQINKIACKYKSGDYALWINGEERGTSTNSSLPSGLSVLAFNDGSLYDFYGKVKAIRVYKEALSDTDLENLTS